MENKNVVIRELFERLDQLTRQQKVFQDEINKIRLDIHKLSTPASSTSSDDSPMQAASKAEPSQVVPAEKIFHPDPVLPTQVTTRQRTRWEEFIGENLLNKVGIAVLVLGIGFGVKYSIDHGLINALTRIILGYFSGLILLIIAYRLRVKHAPFSSVLLSGGMAVLYFTTYAAYDIYHEIPQVLAFILMVMFTVFTVIAAIRYNYEVIGIIGLVGAYAVPLLLSEQSGEVLVLFSYMTIINTGILYLAFRKYWKRLYYAAFAITWLTFVLWYAFSFNKDEHGVVSLVFSTVFFATFYAAFLAYKLIRKEPLAKWDIICMLLNSFIYFGYGYLTIESLPNGEQFLGLFTLFTALVHFAACLFIYKTQTRFSDIFFFVAGMVLVFLTIAIPVQLEGNWVTLVWAAEAVLLFWIGRTKSFPIYEKISYTLMILAFLSLLHDWDSAYPAFYYYGYEENADFRIFANIQFLTSLLVGLSFVLILWIRRKHEAINYFAPHSPITQLINIGIPVLAVFILYAGAFKEIEAFWNNEYAASGIAMQSSDGVGYSQYNDNLLSFKRIWLIMYSALFATALCLVQWRWRTNISVMGCLAFNIVVLFVLITAGLLDIGVLRTTYLDQHLANLYSRDFGNIIIRYVAILSVIPLMVINRRLVRLEYFNTAARQAENLLFHFIVLVLLSSELIHWLDMARVENSFRLALSILWGAYALFLVVVGLSREAKSLRLGAIVLFAVTLLKLFVYDMEDMSTILKTVVMIVLGALLLIASFIYNKYKRSAGNEVP